MGKSNLDPHDQALLEQVMKIVGDDASRITEAIRNVIRNEGEPGRRTYLWNELRRRAERRLNNRKHRENQKVKITPAMRAGAISHALATRRVGWDND